MNVGCHVCMDEKNITFETKNKADEPWWRPGFGFSFQHPFFRLYPPKFNISPLKNGGNGRRSFPFEALQIYIHNIQWLSPFFKNALFPWATGFALRIWRIAVWHHVCVSWMKKWEPPWFWLYPQLEIQDLNVVIILVVTDFARSWGWSGDEVGIFNSLVGRENILQMAYDMILLQKGFTFS